MMKLGERPVIYLSQYEAFSKIISSPIKRGITKVNEGLFQKRMNMEL